jgi:hypothetical protein
MPGAHHHIEVEHALPAMSASVRFHRWVTVLVGLAAATAGVLAYGEAEANRQKEHGFVLASSYAEQIFIGLSANEAPHQFTSNAQRAVVSQGIQGKARVIAAKPGQPFAYAQALDQAEERAGSRLFVIAKQMGTVPAHAPGLDGRTTAALRSSFAQSAALLTKQQEAVDSADTWATRQESTIAALGLVAIAAALGGLAGLMGPGRPGRLSAVTGSVALAAAIVWAAVTFLT